MTTFEPIITVNVAFTDEECDAIKTALKLVSNLDNWMTHNEYDELVGTSKHRISRDNIYQLWNLLDDLDIIIDETDTHFVLDANKTN